MNGPHWIKQWIADLALLNEQFRNDDGSVDFEALGREEYMFRTALITRNFKKSERAKIVYEQAEAAYQVNVERGKKGGRPRKDATTPQPAAISTSDQREGDTGPVESKGRTDAPSRPLPLPSWDAFLSFVDGEGLDYTDAREWWEMTIVDRAGKDRYGNPITNWKAACKRFCKSKTERRSA